MTNTCENPACQWLRSELERRCKQNTRYSVRAFARDLDLAHSTLVRFLGGSRGLSADKATAVADLLHANGVWSKVKAKTFPQLATQRGSSARTNVQREVLLGESYVPATLSQQQILDKWFYIAVLDLLPLLAAPHTAERIGRALGITWTDAQLALKMLVAQRLVEVENTQPLRYRRTETNLHFGDGPKSPLITAYHRQMLQRSVWALDSQDTDSRDFSTISIPTDPRMLKQAREEIRVFRRKMMALMSSGKPDALFQLSIQLYRVSESDDV